MYIIETGADVGWGVFAEPVFAKGVVGETTGGIGTTEGGVDFLSGGADGGGAEALAGDDKRGVAVAR